MLRRSATGAGVRSELGRQASHQCHGEKVQPLHLLLRGFQAGRSQSIPYGRQLLSSRSSGIREEKCGTNLGYRAPTNQIGLKFYLQ